MFSFLLSYIGEVQMSSLTCLEKRRTRSFGENGSVISRKERFRVRLYPPGAVVGVLVAVGVGGSGGSTVRVGVAVGSSVGVAVGVQVGVGNDGVIVGTLVHVGVGVGGAGGR
jgi:hypothetical protein